MRIIAGTRRNHHFEGPLDRATRPTSDRAARSDLQHPRRFGRKLACRRSLFRHRLARLGSISRGASRTIFVERNRGNVALIRRNLITLRLEDRAVVHNTDAFRWARSFRPEPNEPAILFLDPPWLEYDNHPGRIQSLIDKMISLLPRDSIVVVESDKQGKADLFADPELWDHRFYGGTRVSLRHVGEAEPIVAAIADESEPEAEAES